MPFTRRRSTNAASATLTQRSTVKTYARRPPGNGQSQCERYENEAGHGCGTRERESICPQGINQVDKKHRDAEQVAAAGAKVRGEHVFNATRGKKQHHQEEECESRERGREGPAAIA